MKTLQNLQAFPLVFFRAQEVSFLSKKRHFLCLGLFTAFFFIVPVGESDAASHPPLRSEKGIVAADNALASQIGAKILEEGGNAADAGVAVAAALGVLHPFGSGIGGGGFCLYHAADMGDVQAYDFREVAPAAATPDMYLDASGNSQPELSIYGGLAVAVPGEVAGLVQIQRDHGARTLAQNFAPAIKLAREGYPASSKFEHRVASKEKKIRAAGAPLSAWLLPGGELPVAGQTIKNPALGDTLEAIATSQGAAFYGGSRAEALVKAVKDTGGVITIADLKAYAPSLRDAVHGTYRGYEVYSMPPPSSGGVALIQALTILEGYDLGALGAGSSEAFHLITEAMKFAFADRAEFLGDPDFVKVPVKDLLERDYLKGLRGKIKIEHTLPSDAYGPARRTRGDAGTTHFSVIDAHGNMLACTSTINTSFGSLVFVEESGVLLNNEMDDFVQKPGVPNAYGLIGSKANAIAAKKRPLSSMSPTLLLKDGAPFMAVGGSGGPTIISSTLLTILNVIDFGMSARAAIEAPRIHHQWIPDLLFIEPEVSVDVRKNLEAKGHKIKVKPGFSAVQITIQKKDYKTAASDPRKGGVPAAER